MRNHEVHWYAVSGSWRSSCPELIDDVQNDVAQVAGAGNGIVTGGALGVDFVATETALLIDETAERLKVILPTSLDIYAAHYRNRAAEGVITSEQAEALIALLEAVRNRNRHAVVEMQHTVVDKNSYFDRNTAVLDAADELLAYQVNGSEGVQDTVDKARERGMPAMLKTYKVGV